MKTVPLRRAFVVAGAFVAASAMAVTCASVAQAAPVKVATQATAQGVQLRLGTTPVKITPQVKAVWTPGTVGVVTKTNEGQALLGGQSVLAAGVAASKASAGNNASFGCTGLLASGGTLQVGDSGTGCKAVYGSSGGVTVDLTSILSQLPVGLGSISVTANGIIANARFRDGVTSGIGRIDTAHVDVCLGVKLPGVACVGSLVDVPLLLKGTVNEDVVSAIVSSLTKSPQLATLLAPLTTALKSVVSLRTNVQSTNKTTGVITVVGLQLKLLAQSGLTSNLAVATAGPATS